MIDLYVGQRDNDNIHISGHPTISFGLVAVQLAVQLWVFTLMMTCWARNLPVEQQGGEQ